MRRKPSSLPMYSMLKRPSKVGLLLPGTGTGWLVGRTSLASEGRFSSSKHAAGGLALSHFPTQVDWSLSRSLSLLPAPTLLFSEAEKRGLPPDARGRKGSLGG